MTWNAYRNRGEILRAVIAAADARRDGLLPLDVDGAREVFEDDLALLGALQLRWHTRLSGRIEREIMDQPMDLEQAVVEAWCATADELPGIRAVVDQHRAEPTDDAMAEAMVKSTAKERVLLAVMAGLASAHDAGAAAVGARIEEQARLRWAARATTVPHPRGGERQTLLSRLRSVLAA